MIIAVKLNAEECGVPGLTAHRSTNGEGWMISHIRSGLAIAHFPDADSASDLLGAANALAGLTDWTQPGADITDEVSAAEVDDAIAAHGGYIPLFCPRATPEDKADIVVSP